MPRQASLEGVITIPTGFESMTIGLSGRRSTQTTSSSKASIFPLTEPGATPTTHHQLAGKASNILVGLRCWDHSLMLSASDSLAKRSRLPKRKFNNVTPNFASLEKHAQAAFSKSHQLGSNCFGDALAHQLQWVVLRTARLVELCRREACGAFRGASRT